MEEDLTFAFETFDEAMAFHKSLYEIKRSKGYVTCRDVFKLNGSNILDGFGYFDNYGWNNLFHVRVEPYGDDCLWALKMPQMIHLNKNNK